MLSTNRVIVSAAGSGKTTTVVQEAISKPHKKIAVLTYTINNLNEIRKKRPRAYASWTQDEDLELTKYYQEGLSVSQLAKKHQRRTRAGSHRLR